MLSVLMLSVTCKPHLLSVVMLNVVMLNVVVPAMQLSGRIPWEGGQDTGVDRSSSI